MSEELREFHERLTAGRLLALGAAHVSEQLGSFGSWLLIGVGATYALVLANLAAVQQFVWLSTIRTGLVLLLVAVVLGVLQRGLAAILSASSASAEKAEQIGRELAERGIEIDFKVLFREIERGTFYPAKWIIRRSCNHISEGDFAASGRQSAGIAQIQSLLVLAQVGFAVSAIAVIAWGVRI